MRFLKFRPERRKSDLDEEIAAHLALAAADKQEEGADAEDAQHEARREFGNVALVKDRTREAWGWVWLERLLQDARYALRQMRKSPGFAAAVIGTLALGIAAATAMFTVVDHVLLRPLPFPHASRLVDISEKSTKNDYAFVAYLDLAAWRSYSHSFDGIARYNYGEGRSFLGNGSTSAQTSLFYVGPDLFKVLGVQTQFGPGLPVGPNADAHTVVLSDTAWRTVFAADPNILGKTVQINGTPYTVTGVMPRGFVFPGSSPGIAVYAPLALSAADMVRNHDAPIYQVMPVCAPV